MPLPVGTPREPVSREAERSGSTDAARARPDAADAAAPGRRSAGRRRWTPWVAVVLVLVALRLALPLVVASWLEARLSRALGTRVRVGDVGFAPLDAVVTLRAVTVDAPGGAAGDPPAIAAGAVGIDVQWLPLLSRMLLVRELVLGSARIDVARLAGGGSALDAFRDADPARELPPGWTFALDRIVLSDARVRLPGVATGASDPQDVVLREARVSTRRRRATAFARTPNLHVDARVDGGRVRVTGSSDVTAEGLVVDARIGAEDVPLARLGAWGADLGWSALGGRVSGRLHYRRTPGRRDVVAGRLLGRGVEVHVPALDGPALAIRKAVVEVDAVDLRARRVAIDAVTLRGATLAARADGGPPIPLLAGLGGRPAAPAPAPRRRAAADAWRWRIGRLATPAARVRVGGEALLAASLAGENLGPDAYWSPLRASVRGEEGVAEFDGTARIGDGLTLEGRLRAAAVDVPALARAAGAPWAALVQAGRGTADLDVDVALARADGSSVGVHGRAAVSDLWIAGDDPGTFALGARGIGFRVAGVVGDRRGANRRGSGLRVSGATVRAPYALLTRAPEGWLVPPLDAAAPAGIAVEDVSVRGGRLLLVDRAAPPTTTIDVAVDRAWAADAGAAAVVPGTFDVTGSERRLGPLQLVGVRGDDGRWVELSGEAVPLAEAAPFLARAGLPYRFDGGTGAFRARIALGADGWTSDVTVTLHEPAVTGDEAAVEAALGMPARAALDALRGPSGEATLHLTLAGSDDGVARVSPDAIASAVRAAVARAEAAPIPDAPFTVAFEPGSPEPTPDGERQIETIASLLEARPDVVVELTAPPSPADRDRLAARAPAGEPAARGGLIGFVRGALADLMAGRRALDADRLAALRDARLERVVDALAGRHGIARTRVIVAGVEPDARAGPPAVRGKIAVAGGPPSPAEAPEDAVAW